MRNRRLKRALLWAGFTIIPLFGHYPRRIHNAVVLASLVSWALLIRFCFSSHKQLSKERPYRQSIVRVWIASLRYRIKILPSWVSIGLIVTGGFLLIGLLSMLVESQKQSFDDVMLKYNEQAKKQTRNIHKLNILKD